MTLKDPFPFGKYKGLPVSEVPANYIDWLLTQAWFTDEKGKWKEVHDLLTKGEKAVAKPEELKRDTLEDEIITRADADFRPWWEQNYGKRLREAKSDFYIPYLRIALEAWIASRAVLTTEETQETVAVPEAPPEDESEWI